MGLYFYPIMIKEQSFQIAAAIIGCDIPAIKAVHQVEASGAGFMPDGSVKILFEPHIFWRELVNVGIDPRYKRSGNDDILYKEWKRGAYGKYSQQHSRLNRAKAIHSTAALKSASWGSFQILGLNHKKAGYNTVEEMVEDYAKGEAEQLVSFITYLKNTGIGKFLANHEWAKFAKAYNGAGYKGSPLTSEDDYDLRLERAYAKLTT